MIGLLVLLLHFRFLLHYHSSFLEHDLCLFIAELSRHTPAVPVEAVEEPVLTLDQISKQLNVSTKTISRDTEQLTELSGHGLKVEELLLGLEHGPDEEGVDRREDEPATRAIRA